MRIKALRNFSQNGRYYQIGQEYDVTDISVNRSYYEILSVSEQPKTVNEPAKAKTDRKRPMVAAMKPSEVKKTVVRRK